MPKKNQTTIPGGFTTQTEPQKLKNIITRIVRE